MVGKQDCAQTDPSAKYIVGKQSRRGKLTHYHCMKRFININLLLSSNTCQLGFALSSKIHFQNCAIWNAVTVLCGQLYSDHGHL